MLQDMEEGPFTVLSMLPSSCSRSLHCFNSIIPSSCKRSLADCCSYHGPTQKPTGCQSPIPHAQGVFNVMRPPLHWSELPILPGTTPSITFLPKPLTLNMAKVSRFLAHGIVQEPVFSNAQILQYQYIFLPGLSSLRNFL